jgi:HEAT repeat protein
MAAVVAMGLAAARSAPAADPPKNDDLIKQLGGEGTPAAKSATEFEAAYAQVLPQLLEKPQGDDSALQRIAFRASRPGAETERAALSKALVAKLTVDASTPVKVLLLRHLQRIGGDEAVPAIAALLADKDAQVRECARRALSNIPTKSAADAIRGAIDKADDPAWHGALIGALAYRRDPADAPLFARAAARTDDAVRIPAMIALARTGDASALSVLTANRETGSDAAKAVANEACLMLADRLVTLDHRPDAAKIYREYLDAPQQQPRYRCAAIIGLGTAGSEEDIARILGLITDPDVQARGAALSVLVHRRDPGTADHVLAKLAKADTAAKPWLLRALVDLGDKRAGAALLKAVEDEDQTVRIAALTGLARAGDASAVPALLKSAAAKGEEQVAARNTLEVLAGKGVDDALVQHIADAPAVPQRVEAIRALGTRRTPEAVGPLFAATTDAEGSVRSEAFRSLGLIAPFNELPRALALLVNAKEDADRDNAAKAAVAIARKNDDIDARSAPVLAQLAKTEGPARYTLLAVAGQLGGERALAAIRDAVKSDDAKTHEAGVRALTNWPDAAPMQDLLTLAKTEPNNTLAILSLRAYVRLIGMPSKRKPEETVKLYQGAMEIAKRPDEKKMVLGGLGEVKHRTSLEAVAPFLSEDGLQGEACAAAIRIARDVWERNKDLAKFTMTKVLEVSKSDSQKRGAKEILDKIDPPGHVGAE